MIMPWNLYSSARSSRFCALLGRIGGIVLIACSISGCIYSQSPLLDVKYASLVGKNELYVVVHASTVYVRAAEGEGFKNVHQYLLRYRLEESDGTAAVIAIEEIPIRRDFSAEHDVVITPDGKHLLRISGTGRMQANGRDYSRREITHLGFDAELNKWRALDNWKTPPPLMLSPSGRRLLVASDPPVAFDVEQGSRIDVRRLEELVSTISDRFGGHFGGLTDNFNYGVCTARGGLYDRESGQTSPVPEHVRVHGTCNVREVNGKWLFYSAGGGRGSNGRMRTAFCS